MLLYPLRYLWWLVSSIRRSIGRPPDFVLFVLEENLPALPDPPPEDARVEVGRAAHVGSGDLDVADLAVDARGSHRSPCW